ncbi:adenine nucleotide alpha hydrolase [Iamia sp. SCSIO 61187]|nr:adenine nucleotide alpha hydrolase [Iamia sp. SCSIO 61187]
MAWSSGKDSALALHDALDDRGLEVVGLLTTLDQVSAAVTMHDVPRALVEAQAAALGLPLHVVEVPQPCPDGEYRRRMDVALDAARADGVTVVVFGDLHLADVRAYREEAMAGSGLDPVFPLWDEPVDQVAGRIIDLGLAAVVTCVDTDQLDARFVGRTYDRDLLADLPAGVDPCGENGELHTFVTDGPAFAHPVPVAVGPPRTGDRFARVRITPA